MATTPRKRTLYISDLDGTLLNEHSLISPTTAKQLNNLIEKGMLFSIATARTPATVVDLMSEVDLQLPVALMTGALVYDLSVLLYDSRRTANPSASYVTANSRINSILYLFFV